MRIASTLALATLSVAALAALAPTPLRADRFVPADHPTIQAAIDAATDGETIFVAPGTYPELVDYGGKAIAVRSTDGPFATTIDAGGSGTAVMFRSGEGPDSVLDGFTVRGGLGGDIVYNCGGGGGLGLACQAFMAGGVSAFQSSPTVEDCVIVDNASRQGGGVVAFDEAHPVFRNCLIAGNSSIEFNGGGIACVMNSFPTFEHCTIAGNDTPLSGGGIFAASGAVPELRHCILWGNSAPEVHASFTSVAAGWSDVAGGLPGLGNIAADPLFVAGPLGAHYLSQLDAGQAAQSPCVDAGDPALAAPPGTTRTNGVADAGVPDLGFHFPGAAGAAPTFRRGDCNADGGRNLADAIALLAVLFPAGPAGPVPCDDACDSTDDGTLNIADAIALLGWLFGGAADLPEPFTACGADTTADPLGCGGFGACP